jgi:hypothetical protein
MKPHLKFNRTILDLHENPQLVAFFSDNLQLLYKLGSMSESLKREWALNCYANPCTFRMKRIPSVSLVDKMTLKFPFYVWHKSKRLQPLQILEQCQDREEENMVNLFSSDYLYESIDLIER